MGGILGVESVVIVVVCKRSRTFEREGSLLVVAASLET